MVTDPKVYGDVGSGARFDPWHKIVAVHFEDDSTPPPPGHVPGALTFCATGNFFTLPGEDTYKDAFVLFNISGDGGTCIGVAGPDGPSVGIVDGSTWQIDIGIHCEIWGGVDGGGPLGPSSILEVDCFVAVLDAATDDVLYESAPTQVTWAGGTAENTFSFDGVLPLPLPFFFKIAFRAIKTAGDVAIVLIRQYPLSTTVTVNL